MGLSLGGRALPACWLHSRGAGLVPGKLGLAGFSLARAPLLTHNSWALGPSPETIPFEAAAM